MSPETQTTADHLVAAATRIALAPATAPAALNLDDEICTGRLPDFVERLRAPLQKLALHEGLLVQNLALLALSDHPGLLVLPRFRAEITDADRQFLSRNPNVNLDPIAPPAPGQRVGAFEVDGLIYDTERRTLVLLDVKRSPRAGESIQPLREASLDARRLLQVQHPIVATETWLLRWFGSEADALKPHMLTRNSVDARLGFEIRAVVDYGLRAFRDAFTAHFRTLLGAPAPAAADVAPARPVHNRDVAAFQALFGRNARRGRVQ